MYVGGAIACAHSRLLCGESVCHTERAHVPEHDYLRLSVLGDFSGSVFHAEGVPVGSLRSASVTQSRTTYQH